MDRYEIHARRLSPRVDEGKQGGKEKAQVMRYPVQIAGIVVLYADPEQQPALRPFPVRRVALSHDLLVDEFYGDISDS